MLMGHSEGFFLPDVSCKSGYNAFMKLATTPEELRRWMKHWRNAAIVLEEMKRHELQTLSEEEAWREIEAIQSAPEIWRDPETPPGLIAQQALFRKLR